MAHYQIELTHFQTCYCAADTVETRRRGDAAKAALWRAVYAMIESEGLRDRPRAHELRAAVDAADVSPVKAGWTRKLEFRLREKEPFPNVTLRINAR